MKKYLAALTTVALINVAPFALAASSTDLTVTGTITPSACTLDLSGSGAVDYGKIPVSSLSFKDYTLLPEHPMQLVVNCEAATLFALEPIDNRPDTSAEIPRFGLGLTKANEKLGFIDVNIYEALADTQQAYPIGSWDGGATWYWQRFMNSMSIISVSTTANDRTPVPAQALTMNLGVIAGIAPLRTLTLDEEVRLDGSVTIQVKYM